MFLVRKIHIPYWDKVNNDKWGLDQSEISANAVTHDLKTSRNQLSFWTWDGNDRSHVKAIALAILTTGEHIEPLDVVWIPVKALQADGIAFNATEGLTPMWNLAKFHVDVCSLDYGRVGKLASCVRRSVDCGHYKRLRKPKIKELLKEALRAERINMKNLHPKMLERLQCLGEDM